MRVIRAVYRAIAFLYLCTQGVILTILLGWIPVTVREVGLGTWVVHLTTRVYLRVIGVHVHLSDPERWHNHAGFIFTNHTSYMDILTILGTSPVRFVAKAEIRSWPFIGWFAATIGCIFVKREKKNSRKEARQALSNLDTLRPPVILFPEGKTSRYGTLLPFRLGAFEIAHGAEIEYMPTAIVYSDPDLVDWKSRPAREAFWELLSRGRTLDVHFHLLPSTQPTQEDDPADLMNQTRALMLETLATEAGYQRD